MPEPSSLRSGRGDAARDDSGHRCPPHHVLVGRQRLGALVVAQRGMGFNTEISDQFRKLLTTSHFQQCSVSIGKHISKRSKHCFKCSPPSFLTRGVI